MRRTNEWQEVGAKNLPNPRVEVMAHSGSVHVDHYNYADRGPIVRIRSGYREGETYVVSYLGCYPSGATIALGCRLTSKGEADRRGISTRGGMKRRYVDLRDVEVVGFLMGTWGTAD